MADQIEQMGIKIENQQKVWYTSVCYYQKRVCLGNVVHLLLHRLSYSFTSFTAIWGSANSVQCPGRRVLWFEQQTWVYRGNSKVVIDCIIAEFVITDYSLYK